METKKFAVEWQWTYDHSGSIEYLIFSLEQESPHVTFADMLEWAKNHARKCFDQICPAHGARELLKLHVVEEMDVADIKDGRNLLTCKLKPVHDFTKERPEDQRA